MLPPSVCTPLSPLQAVRVREEEEEVVRRKGAGTAELREMVTPLLRKNLTKQGNTHDLIPINYM